MSNGVAQVNASPSLASDTTSDFQLKFAAVDAALTLADIEGNFGGNLPVSYNGFDLIFDNNNFIQVSSRAPMQLFVALTLNLNAHCGMQCAVHVADQVSAGRQRLPRSTCSCRALRIFLAS